MIHILHELYKSVYVCKVITIINDLLLIVAKPYKDISHKLEKLVTDWYEIKITDHIYDISQDFNKINKNLLIVFL